MYPTASIGLRVPKRSLPAQRLKQSRRIARTIWRTGLCYRASQINAPEVVPIDDWRRRLRLLREAAPRGRVAVIKSVLFWLARGYGVERKLRGERIGLAARPIPMRGLLTILRNAAPMRVMNAEIGLRAGMAFLRAFLKPFHRFGKVLWHARAISVKNAKSALGEDIPFVSRTLKPSSGLNIALGNACAMGVEDAERALVGGTLLIGGFLKPIRSSLEVLAHAITVGVDPAEERLSLADVESSGVQTPGPRL